jgi:hypothetical protein
MVDAVAASARDPPLQADDLGDELDRDALAFDIAGFRQTLWRAYRE